jgi:hypothetical protein
MSSYFELRHYYSQCPIYKHTYHSRLIPEAPTFYENYLAMRNTADVSGGSPVTVWSQFISGVCAINPLVAFYDIHERIREVLLFYFVSDTTRDYRQFLKHVTCHTVLTVKYFQSSPFLISKLLRLKIKCRNLTICAAWCGVDCTYQILWNGMLIFRQSLSRQSFLFIIGRKTSKRRRQSLYKSCTVCTYILLPCISCLRSSTAHKIAEVKQPLQRSDIR